MTQPAVDLPDPLDPRAAGVSNNADDLLAQLAGDEVDRLLAESESGSSALSSANVDRAGNPNEAALDALYSQLTAAPVEPLAALKPEAPPDERATPPRRPELAAPEPASEATQRMTQNALDDLFAQLQAPDGVDPAAPSATVPAAVAVPSIEPSTPDAAPVAPSAGHEESARDVADTEAQAQAILTDARKVVSEETGIGDGPGDLAPSSAPEPPSAAEALAAEMDADERAHSQALSQISEPAALPPADAPAFDFDSPQGQTLIEDHTPDEEDDADATPSLMIRVLEWLNAPLANVSDSVREALGKVALVTLFNSIAVLIYVMLFRKH